MRIHVLVRSPRTTFLGDDVVPSDDFSATEISPSEICLCTDCKAFGRDGLMDTPTQMRCKLCSSRCVKVASHSIEGRASATRGVVCPKGCVICPKCVDDHGESVPLEISSIKAKRRGDRPKEESEGNDGSSGYQRWLFKCKDCTWMSEKFDANSEEILKDISSKGFPTSKISGAPVPLDVHSYEKILDQWHRASAWAEGGGATPLASYKSMASIGHGRSLTKSSFDSLIGPSANDRVGKMRGVVGNINHINVPNESSPDEGTKFTPITMIYKDMETIRRRVKSLNTPETRMSEDASIRRPPFEAVPRNRNLVPLPAPMLPVRRSDCHCGRTIRKEVWDESLDMSVNSLETSADTLFPRLKVCGIVDIRGLPIDGPEGGDGWLVISLENRSRRPSLSFSVLAHPQFPTNEAHYEELVAAETLLQPFLKKDPSAYLRQCALYLKHRRTDLLDRVVPPGASLFHSRSPTIQIRAYLSGIKPRRVPLDLHGGLPRPDTNAALAWSAEGDAQGETVELAIKMRIPKEEDRRDQWLPLLIVCDSIPLYYAIHPFQPES